MKLTLCALLIAATASAQLEDRVRHLESLHGLNVCGNGVLESDFVETCDTLDLGGLDCPALGFDTGTLRCSPSCELDLSDCRNAPPPVGQLGVRMDTPPGGSLDAFDSWVDSQCGAPRSAWPAYEVGPGKPYASTTELKNAIPAEGLAVVRVHSQGTMYPTLALKGKKCVEVVGVGMPEVQGVNMAGGYSTGETVKPGGLIVRGVNVRESANCVGVPADRQFLAIEDSIIERCVSHGFLTDDDATHFYVRLMRTHLRDGGASHLAYIDRVARADVLDNLCENPGGGHCIRVVARSFHVARNRVSSVSLDGTLKEKFDKPGTGAMSVGMHPLETYACSEGVVEDNEITYYLANNSTPGGFKVRGRGDLMSCDLEGKTPDGRLWVELHPDEERYQDPALWATVGADLDAKGVASRYAFRTLYQRNVTRVLGPGSTVKDRAVSVQTNSSWPQHTPVGRDAIPAKLKALVSEHPELQPGGAAFVSWEETCKALAGFTEDRNLDWILLQVRPEYQRVVCGGKGLTDWIAMPAPGNWRERNFFEWGTGNRTLVCSDFATCVDATPNLQMDDKQRLWFHPGEPTMNLINTGGAVAVQESGTEQ